MIGAIIGDLAAWTWEHDQECFYKQLVSPDAKFSGYGMLALELWKPIHEEGLIHKNRLYTIIGKSLLHTPSFCEVPSEWRKWGMSDYETQPIPLSLKLALVSAAFVDSADLPKARQQELNWVHFFHCGKQEYYGSFILTILRRLREGKTKVEAIEGIPDCVFNYYEPGHGHHLKYYLDYVTFAWRCFYYSFDFTSALHNAMKCNSNRHLAAFLTGAFAEAMYGCSYAMTKRKYNGNDIYHHIEFPKAIEEDYGGLIRNIRAREFTNRIFFPKNDALTNVELHKWTPIENPYKDFPINAELRRRMMKAYGTSWEQRYGVYLDNGWFYTYRSHCLLHRYQLTPVSQSEWRITHLQKSNDPQADELHDVELVIEALESFWYTGHEEMFYNLYSVGDTQAPANMKYCCYFRGETQCPKAFKSSPKEYFWYGEKMFIENSLNLQEWVMKAQSTLESLPPKKKKFAKRFPIETFAIICYIEMLFSKWRPYDSMEWIFEY